MAKKFQYSCHEGEQTSDFFVNFLLTIQVLMLKKTLL